MIPAWIHLSCAGVESTTTTSTSWDARSFSEPGLPYFQLQVYTRSGEENGVEISLGVSTESVIFVRRGITFEAACEIVCRVVEAESESERAETSWTDTIRTDQYQKTRSREFRYMSRFLPLRPGRFLIEATLTDLHSGKSASRIRRVTVNDAAHDGPFPAGIQLHFTDRQGREVPLLGPYIEQGKGMLVCAAPINNLLPGDSVRAIATVLQGSRDTSLPRVPYSFDAVRGSAEYAGIDFDVPVTMRRDTMTFTHPQESVARWQYSPGEQGLYLIGIECSVFRNGVTPEMRTEFTRPLVVVSRGFPRPSEIEQLLGSLTFIMSESENDSVRTARTDEHKRELLEQFWRSSGKNETAVDQIIERYYGRVEEANEYFSSFTEGWRTDRGMIYIVLGPPVSVQTGLQGEIWNYSYVEGDQLNSYFFRDVFLPEQFQSFEHLVLERKPYYDQAWIEAVDRWRRGWGY